MLYFQLTVISILAFSCSRCVAQSPPGRPSGETDIHDRRPATGGEFGVVDTSRNQSWRARVYAGERFDLMFSRTFMFSGSQPDTFPINGAQSGIISVGAAVNLLLAERLKFRIMPAIAVSKLVFLQNAEKTFPTPADSLSSEKLRSTYLELGLSLAWVLGREAGTNRTITQFELGVTPGLHLGSSYKVGVRVDGNYAKLKFTSDDPINQFRCAAIGRLTYRFIGVYGLYRLTTYFTEGSRDEIGRVYPPVVPWELGFTVQL